MAEGTPYHTCPFCDEPDFDLPGLASHIRNHCSAADEAEQVIIDYHRGNHERAVARIEAERATARDSEGGTDG